MSTAIQKQIIEKYLNHGRKSTNSIKGDMWSYSNMLKISDQGSNRDNIIREYAKTLKLPKTYTKSYVEKHKIGKHNIVISVKRIKIIEDNGKEQDYFKVSGDLGITKTAEGVSSFILSQLSRYDGW